MHTLSVDHSRPVAQTQAVAIHYTVEGPPLG